MKPVKPFYYPPTLLARQFISLLTLKKVCGYRFKGRLIKNLSKLLKIAAGARAYGCFGYMIHPVYEVTAKCNLKCVHCHAKGGLPYPGELDTASAKRVIYNLTTMKDFRTLVFTGGEPILRHDIFELTRYADELGFNIIYATNGTLITKEIAHKMADSGVIGVAISLDSINPSRHDWLRQVNGAWEKALNGIKYTRDEGLYLQINITVSRMNYDEIPDLLRFSDKLGAHVILLYHFVPFGRGEILKKLALTGEEYAKLIKKVVDMQGEIEAIISPIAFPSYYAYIVAKSGISPEIAKNWITGCIAARGMFYIKPDGEVWPCAFLPISGGNIVEKTAIEIWNSPIFRKLRDRSNLEEPCKSCPYREVCGGCRGRAYMKTGNPFAADPSCILRKHLP